MASVDSTHDHNGGDGAPIHLQRAVIGVLPQDKGGTGKSTRAAALKALLPAQAGKAGRVLGTNGNDADWVESESNPAHDHTQGNGAPINLQSAVTGVLPVAKGGTGKTTPTAALNGLLPSQSGKRGHVLVSNGALPQWEPGDAYTTSRTMKLAASALSAMRVVRSTAAGKAAVVDAANAAHAGCAEGITISAASAEDEVVTLALAGAVENSSLTWTPGQPVYIGPSGTLTQTAPTNGFVQQAGVANSAHSMIINFGQAIIIG